MAYKVIEYFTDLQDDNFAYNVGDKYPREGKDVSEERLTELSTGANLRGVPLIEEVRGAEETADATISKKETVATTEEDSEVEDADNAAPVEEEPKKRGRKRKADE